jgi:hypothetical protein
VEPIEQDYWECDNCSNVICGKPFQIAVNGYELPVTETFRDDTDREIAIYLLQGLNRVEVRHMITKADEPDSQIIQK